VDWQRDELVAGREADRVYFATPRVGAEASGDPMVISRYLYKTGLPGGLDPFTTSAAVLFLWWTGRRSKCANSTSGESDGHSQIGRRTAKRILFVSNREPIKTILYYDVFALCVAEGSGAAIDRY